MAYGDDNLSNKESDIIGIPVFNEHDLEFSIQMISKLQFVL